MPPLQDGSRRFDSYLFDQLQDKDMLEYTIVAEDSTHNMQVVVNRLLKQRWKLRGKVFVINYSFAHRLHQVMTRKCNLAETD